MNPQKYLNSPPTPHWHRDIDAAYNHGVRLKHQRYLQKMEEARQRTLTLVLTLLLITGCLILWGECLKAFGA